MKVEIKHKYCTKPVCVVSFNSFSDARSFMDRFEQTLSDNPLLSMSLRLGK